jgi:SAM-dependent methyltransferase
MSGKSKSHLLKFFLKWQVLLLRLSSSKFKYQPTLRTAIFPVYALERTRPCEDRWAIIRSFMPAESKTILDIGSNSGYYLFRFADLGYLCHGIESDPDLVFFTSLQNYILNTKSVSCECGKFDLQFVQYMPSYDVVLCLSLMHHIIMAEGIDVAEATLRGLAQKTNHVLFYEMGQSNETKADWSHRLPQMNPDPEVWISQWLIKCGFMKVKTIGTSQTTVPRYLFAAYP